MAISKEDWAKMSKHEQEERRKIAHTAWWGMMICSVGAVVVFAQLIWLIVVALT